MLMNKIHTLLMLALCSCSSIAFAETEIDQIRSECKKLTHLASLGQAAYQQKNYLQALDYFQDQAAWTDFCSLHEDSTGKIISDSQRATAYNNVGLTHAQLNQPRWAKAWYAILAQDAKSQYNRNKLKPVQSSTVKTGTYVKYIGQGAWDTIEVRTEKNQYHIDYAGLRMGINGMIYGPNMGEFSTQMAKNADKAQYRYESCVINLKFHQGESIQVQQSQADCGFGMGVYAEGNYVKVENLQDYARYN